MITPVVIRWPQTKILKANCCGGEKTMCQGLGAGWRALLSVYGGAHRAHPRFSGSSRQGDPLLFQFCHLWDLGPWVSY